MSWHPGKIRPLAMFAFFNNSRATNLSFELASSSSNIDRTCFKCLGLKRCATSPNAVEDNVRIAPPGIDRYSTPLIVVVDTADDGRICLYSVISSSWRLAWSCWKSGEYEKSENNAVLEAAAPVVDGKRLLPLGRETFNTDFNDLDR